MWCRGVVWCYEVPDEEFVTSVVRIADVSIRLYEYSTRSSILSKYVVFYVIHPMP